MCARELYRISSFFNVMCHTREKRKTQNIGLQFSPAESSIRLERIHALSFFRATTFLVVKKKTRARVLYLIVFKLY